MNQRDWEFTEDGDLMSGDPKTDIEGSIIYLHMDGTESTENDEGSKPIRDIGYVSSEDAELQIVRNRLRTDAPDWYHHPSMGGNMTDLIGEPNTRETGAVGAEHIFNALIYGNLYDRSQVTVRPVPISHTEILFMIEIEKFRETFRFPFIFSLEKGMLDYYEVQPETIEGDDHGVDILEPVLPEEPTDGTEVLPDVEEVAMEDLPDEYQYEEPDAADMEDAEEEDDGMDEADMEGFVALDIKQSEVYDSEYEEDFLQ